MPGKRRTDVTGGFPTGAGWDPAGGLPHELSTG